jgi:glycine cleavage system H protein
LGDVVYVLPPDVGTELKQDEEAGSVESVKAASEVYTPVSGTVLEVNTELEKMPSKKKFEYKSFNYFFYY